VPLESVELLRRKE